MRGLCKNTGLCPEASKDPLLTSEQGRGSSELHFNTASNYRYNSKIILAAIALNCKGARTDREPKARRNHYPDERTWTRWKQ